MITVPLRGWSSLNIWETNKQIKIHEAIKNRLKSGNTCYHSVKNICLPVCYPKIKIYITITLPFVLYGCDTPSFRLKEERRLKMFGNRVFQRIFGPEMD